MIVVQVVSVLVMLVWMKVTTSVKSSASISTLRRSDDVFDNAAVASHVGENFVVRLQGCTGSMISQDWILTAAHCFQSLGGGNGQESNADIDLRFDEDDGLGLLFVHKKASADRIKGQILWTKPLTPPTDTTKAPYWRKVDRIVMHKRFKGEALSWQGYDLALLHLAPEYGREATEDLQLVPVCLAAPGFPEFEDSMGQTFVAGYGRRRIPHCMTDDKSPETFEVCARPVWCSHEPRTSKCGIKFLYKGVEHKSCIFEETPSASDPECVKLRQSDESLENSKKTIHVFDQNGKFLTSCYPKKPSSKSKGWCVTRQPGVDVDQEPSYHKGWGFCSDDPFQESCTTHIPEVLDTADIQTSVLTDLYCVDKLEANLIVEQPGVDRATYEPLLPKSKVFCVGRNKTKNFEDDLFYVRSADSNSYKSVKPSEPLVEVLKTDGGISRDLVDGGPSCFGDSGGPFWRLVNNPDKKNTPTPVLVGVFSFMLWGTCTGRSEPAYYGRVSDHLDWIHKYVPKTDTCVYSTKFQDRQ